MKKLLPIVLISLLLSAGISFALVKAPSTTIKINATNTSASNTTSPANTSIKITSTIIAPINITKTTTNESANIIPTMSVSGQKLNVTKTPTNDSGYNIIPTCATCGIGKVPQLIVNATLNQTCSMSDVGGLLRYSHHYGDHADFDMPDYLDDIREDCDLLGLDDEINDDLDAKLGNVSLIEDGISAIENESQLLMERGLAAIDCLREAQEAEPAEVDYSHVMAMEIETGRMYPSFPMRSHIGSSYRISGIYDYVATQLENFNYAYENVYTGYSYTNASMENLLNITLGLEDFCRRRECVYPEDKDFYESLLEHEQGDLLYYANATKRFIDDAEDFAQDYHDLKTGIERADCMEFLAPSTHVPWTNINLENVTNDTPKQVISPVKLAANFSNVTNVSLIGGEQPKYVIQSKVRKKFLWMFEVQVETKTELNAQNGQIISEEKPWWGFLLTN